MHIDSKFSSKYHNIVYRVCIGISNKYNNVILRHLIIIILVESVLCWSDIDLYRKQLFNFWGRDN